MSGGGECRSHGEVLKAVFPLLDGEDLASCMLVSRQWREIAGDEYFWKCVCGRRWPSVCKRPPHSLISYRRLYQCFSKPPPPQPLLPPQISFQDLDFYIDLWSDGRLIFSEPVSGSSIRAGGIRNRPKAIPDILASHLDDPSYKMIVQVEPSFALPIWQQRVAASVLAARRDTGKMACILNSALFDYVDRSASRALAYDYLSFSPAHPFVSGIRAWASLLFLAAAGEEDAVHVFGIEIDFCDAASSEEEVLWLLDMLDWK